MVLQRGVLTWIIVIVICVCVWCERLQLDFNFDDENIFQSRLSCPGCKDRKKPSISSVKLDSNGCKELPKQDLQEILGAAFNPRYMSITDPSNMDNHNGKRNPSSQMDFYVDQQYAEELGDRPAWTVNNHVQMQLKDLALTRRKREVLLKQEWQCDSTVKWIDLGPDYFPRYLRTVECIIKNCWFTLYRCTPKSFTVKLLRRKKNKCAYVYNGHKVGSYGLPEELKEWWVWEERAVTFCCDCTYVGGDGRGRKD